MRAWMVIAVSLTAVACRRSPETEAPRKAPTLVLWAWDRAEDLRFLKPGQAEVAGLMATLQLRDGRVDVWHRKLPLFVSPGVALEAVIRLESDGSDLPPVDRVADIIANVGHREFSGVQVDFDARESQVYWYRSLLHTLDRRSQKPLMNLPNLSPGLANVSITALASWCLERPWFAESRHVIREVVPMLFRMGPERIDVLERLNRQKDFAEGCRGSVGVASDEPLPWHPPADRIYIFSPTRWTLTAFEEACAHWL